jgi:hypothetical protein
MVSNGFAPDLPPGSIGRYAVIGAAAAGVALRSEILTARLRRATAMTVALGVFLFVHAIVFSEARDVSLLKSAVWTTVVLTLMAAWNGLTIEDRGRLEAEVFGGVTALALLSLPLVRTEYGYLRNGAGFQGLLNQPQAFGGTIAPVGAWIAGRALEKGRPPWKSLVVLAILALEILLSESRTAGAALAIGLTAGVATSVFKRGSFTRSTIPGLFSARSALLVVLAIAALAIAQQQAAERLSVYFEKRAGVASPFEAYEAARGQFITDMLANIKERPWSGIGFGIASDASSMQIEREGRWGIPTGASVEKGVMPVAIVEEVGIPGAMLVALWLGVILHCAARRGFVASAVAWTALSTNLGEATLFSPGGLGMLMLIAVTWASARAPATPNSRATP